MQNKARVAASHLPQRSQLAVIAGLQQQKYKPMVIIKTISDERKRREELENIMAYVSTPKEDSKSDENDEQSTQTDENSSDEDDEQQEDQKKKMNNRKYKLLCLQMKLKKMMMIMKI